MGVEQTPRHFPWPNLKGWVMPTPRRHETHNPTEKRRTERDPNHPRWRQRYFLLIWWDVRIRLIGSDPEGRQCISITKGSAEPLYIRVGRTLEVWRGGAQLDVYKRGK